MRRALLIFIAALAFLAGTVPRNHNEAEDACYYARMTESGPGSELFHRHHLLYLPAGRAIYAVARAAGYSGRALPVLTGWSLIAGAAAVACMVALLGRAGRFGAAGLLFSYGFWRYSLTAEIYAPAIALMLGAFVCAARSDRRKEWTTAGAALGALAVLLHLAAVPAVLLGIPALYAARGEWRRAMGHGGLVLGLAAVVYGCVALGPGTVAFADTGIPRAGLMSRGAGLGALAAAGHTLISGNFVFSLAPLAERVQALLPHRMLQEELFMGLHAPPWTRGLAPVTAVSAALALGALAVAGIGGAWRRRTEPRGADHAVLAGAASWLAGSAGLALIFEPSNPEMWIPALPALWICADLVWACAGFSRAGAMRWAPAAAVALLLAHNAIGGMALVRSPSGDYCRRKAAWVSDRAGPGDWILTADSHSMVTYLEYQTSARVIDGRYAGLKQWNALLRDDPPVRVWVLGEFMDPPPAITRRTPWSEQRRRELAEALRPGLKPAHRDEDGTVYTWSAPKEIRAP